MGELKPLNTPQAGSAGVHFFHFSSCSYLVVNKETQLHLSLFVSCRRSGTMFVLTALFMHAGASGGFEGNSHVFVCLALTTAMTHSIPFYSILFILPLIWPVS